MDILNDITVICFSPTHTSRTIAEAVAAGMNAARIRTVDLTLDRSDSPITVGAGETVVLGAPVYAGRVAPEAVRRLRRIQVAAGASEMPVAEGRPDTLDLADARIFGGECARKLDSSGAFAPFHIKGNRPYKEVKHSGNQTVPETADGCSLCGECVRVCPTGAVSIDLNARKVLTDPALCIRCCACVRACPAGLRTYTTPFTAFLHEHCSARRDPETFL